MEQCERTYSRTKRGVHHVCEVAVAQNSTAGVSSGFSLPFYLPGFLFTRVLVYLSFKITLPLTNMATDRGSLQKEIKLPGTSPQVPC